MLLSEVSNTLNMYAKKNPRQHIPRLVKVLYTLKARGRALSRHRLLLNSRVSEVQFLK
jgi:hypothetical protein